MVKVILNLTFLTTLFSFTLQNGFLDLGKQCWIKSVARLNGTAATCKDGYEHILNKCVQNCPTGKGWTSDITYCHIPEQGYSRLVQDDDYCRENISDCEKIGTSYYKRAECTERGFIAAGDTCKPFCPAAGMNKYFGGNSCIRQFYDVICPFGQEFVNGQCYGKCAYGLISVGNLCVGQCPDGYTQCGAICKAGFFNFCNDSDIGQKFDTRTIDAVNDYLATSNYKEGDNISFIDAFKKHYTDVKSICS
jgi:hypothetical protein